jgi:hypothetical protein
VGRIGPAHGGPTGSAARPFRRLDLRWPDRATSGAQTAVLSVNGLARLAEHEPQADRLAWRQLDRLPSDGVLVFVEADGFGLQGAVGGPDRSPLDVTLARPGEPVAAMRTMPPSATMF